MYDSVSRGASLVVSHVAALTVARAAAAATTAKVFMVLRGRIELRRAKLGMN